eukprot:6210457-Pleurochrysis_carterae.AAC.2
MYPRDNRRTAGSRDNNSARDWSWGAAAVGAAEQSQRGGARWLTILAISPSRRRRARDMTTQMRCACRKFTVRGLGRGRKEPRGTREISGRPSNTHQMASFFELLQTRSMHGKRY